MSPANIQDALRMLADGKRFRYECAVELLAHEKYGPCAKSKVKEYFEISPISMDMYMSLKKWQLIEEPEPVFEFKTWDRCLMRDDLGEWIPCEFSYTGREYFCSVDENLWEKLTAYSDDLVGTNKTPSTPVWIVKDGKPEVFK